MEHAPSGQFAKVTSAAYKPVPAGAKSYKVSRGDTLSSIARKHAVEVSRPAPLEPPHQRPGEAGPDVAGRAALSAATAVAIRALTLDLDDTLWPVMPALERADQDLDAYLRTHHPEVARAWPIPAMRELRARIAAERADLAHDFTTQRHLTMQHAFASCGIDEAPIEALWEVYFSARNRVELFEDSLPALRRITARWPVASLTNGNADLDAHRHRGALPSPVERTRGGCAQAAAADLPRGGGTARRGAARGAARGRRSGAGRGRRARGRVARGMDQPRGAAWPAELGEPPELDLPDMTALADWLDLQARRRT